MLRRFALALVLCLFSSPVLAAPGPKLATAYSAKIAGAAFTTKALNASKTFDAVNIGGYETVLVEVAYVYASATHVTMTCFEGLTAATAVFKIPETSSGGAGTVLHYQRTWSWVTGGVSSSFFFEVPVRYQWLTCTLLGTAAGAGDTATVTLWAQE
jgi:hypothetical protein